MGTRATVHFNHEGETEAIVYRHLDGYPEGLGEDLKEFFTDVENLCRNDTRFNDPQYLAAKFVVWQANRYSGKNLLDFLSVGVCQEDPGDIEYCYSLDCSSNNRPKIRVEEVR